MDKILISIITGLVGMFSWGVGEFTAKKAVDKLGNLKSFFWIQLITLSFVLLILPFIKIDLSITLKGLLLTLLVTVVYATAYLCTFKAYSKGNLSIVGPIVGSYGMISALTAFLFLGQRLVGFQLVGIPLVLIGIILVSMEIDIKNKGNLKLTAGLIPALLGSFFFGINTTIIDYTLEEIDWLLFMLISITSSVTLLTLFFVVTRQKIMPKGVNMPWPALVAAAFLTNFANAAVVFGFSVGDSIIISPLGSASVAVTVLMAVIFLKEKLNPIQIFGILLTVSGIILTAL